MTRRLLLALVALVVVVLVELVLVLVLPVLRILALVVGGPVGLRLAEMAAAVLSLFARSSAAQRLV